MTFIHPLSEFTPANNDVPDDTMNLWAFASLIVDGAINGNTNATMMLQECLMTFNPLMNFNVMLDHLKNGSESAKLQAINWAKEGLEIKFDKAFGK